MSALIKIILAIIQGVSGFAVSSSGIILAKTLWAETGESPTLKLCFT